MADWYYFNENGEKVGPIRGRDLKQLAQQGTVTPDTRVEDENGRVVLAKNVTGLTFLEATESEMVSFASSTVILPPSAEPNPFTAIPVAQNPFAAVPPVLEKPFAVHTPKANPQKVAVPIAGENRKSFGATMASTMRSLMSLIASMTGFVLVLLLCGMVVIVLINLFYATQPGFVPPRWLEPVLFLNRAEPQDNGGSVSKDVVIEQEADAPQEEQQRGNTGDGGDGESDSGGGGGAETGGQNGQREPDGQTERDTRLRRDTQVSRSIRMDDGFHIVRGFNSGYPWDRSDAVAYGRAVLHAELRRTATELADTLRNQFVNPEPFQAAVVTVQGNIRAERDRIAKQAFFWDRTWSRSNLVVDLPNDKASFTMTIDVGFVISGKEQGIVEEISLFPTMGITVTEARSNSNDRIVLNLSGSAASIQELWENQSSYQFRVWFDNMRYNRDVPSSHEGTSWSYVRANVLRMEIFDTRRNFGVSPRSPAIVVESRLLELANSPILFQAGRVTWQGIVHAPRMAGPEAVFGPPARDQPGQNRARAVNDGTAGVPHLRLGPPHRLGTNIRDGRMVANLHPESPLARAGVRNFDIVTNLNGQPLDYARHPDGLWGYVQVTWIETNGGTTIGRTQQARIFVPQFLPAIAPMPQVQSMPPELPLPPDRQSTSSAIATAQPVARDQQRQAGERMVLTIKNIQYPFRWCPAGRFMMGSPERETGRNSNERQHQVTLTRGFWMLETEVTQAMWKSVMGENPSKSQGERLPVENVSWNDSQGYIKILNDLRVAPAGFKFSLPTEAQWEYACRAGTTTAFHFGNTWDKYKANFLDSGLRRNITVGSYPANAWGLRDMHGNVWEWCQDWFEVYPNVAVTDPAGPSHGSMRVYRGGAGSASAQSSRSAFRNRDVPSHKGDALGIRLALVRVE
ncbi:MAG: SUMF1/EgtB/PvdO family nonheme iron enzyme [Planctomycetaceae bacterium]|nr:SUMF1/EgtB/PvdO family nonheme iron enzyme [Planctomycetaceae bacterium]